MGCRTTGGSRGRRLRVRRLALAVGGVALVGAACTSDGQDPGLVPQEVPAQPSDTLGRCPPGGPDATTPPVGCLGPDGQVLRP